MAKRRIWFEYSWWQGAWPVSSEGWTLFLASPAICIGLLCLGGLIESRLPGSWLSAIPWTLMVMVALATQYLVFTHMRRRGEPREDEINHTARRLFGRGRWRGGIGGGRRPAPLVPGWPPGGQDPDQTN